MFRRISYWLQQHRLRRLSEGDVITLWPAMGIREDHQIVSLSRLDEGLVEVRIRVGFDVSYPDNSVLLPTADLWKPVEWEHFQREEKRLFVGKVVHLGLGVQHHEKRLIIDLDQVAQGLVTIKRLRWFGDADRYDEEVPWPAESERVALNVFWQELKETDFNL